MKAPLHGRPNQMLLLFSAFLTIPHIILFLDSTFPGPVCKDYAFLNVARNRDLLYLGSLYSAAISTWALFANHGDFFSCHLSSPKLNGNPIKIRTSPDMARENSRYLCVLTMALLSEITLAMDLSWAWYQGVIYVSSLPLVTEIGDIHKLMSMMVFPSCNLWLTMMWTIGNLIPFMALGNLVLVGIEADVKQVVRWDRSSRRLGNYKKEQ